LGVSRTLSASVIEDLDSWQSDWIPALGPALPFLKSAARGQALFGGRLDGAARLDGATKNPEAESKGAYNSFVKLTG
jgi:hypothetical protein